MKALAALLHELLGLFVEDNSLALAVLAVVAVACLLAFVLAAPAEATGLFLVLGCLGALLLSTLVARG